MAVAHGGSWERADDAGGRNTARDGQQDRAEPERAAACLVGRPHARQPLGDGACDGE